MKCSFKSIIVRRYKAFTLAEVLITLAIIGIVAALTIPSLMNNIQNMQYKVAWKKSFANINNGLALYFSDGKSIVVQPHPSFFNDLINDKTFNVVKRCTSDTPCSAGYQHALEDLLGGVTYKFMDGSTHNGMDANSNADDSILLADGSAIGFNLRGDNYGDPWTVAVTKDLNVFWGILIVDVNGAKGPNQYGVDVFGGNLKGDRLIPWGPMANHRPDGNLSVTDDPDNCNFPTKAGETYWGFICSSVFLLK